MHLLSEKKFWIFDLDGTLTRAQHDFEAIRQELGVPTGRPILEYLDQLPPAQAGQKHQDLERIELEIAGLAVAQEGADALLSLLVKRGCRIGILTRNGRLTCLATLEAAGLAHHFPSDAVISRSCALPKPSPDGIQKLLRHWQGAPSEAVMVGDFLFDLECGRRANAMTVYFDADGVGQWGDQADLTVNSHLELLRLIS